MSNIKLMINPLLKFYDFKGRATRKEYFLFLLFQVLVIFLPLIFSFISYDITGGFGILSTFFVYFYYIVFFLLIIPHFTVTIRRLHDANSTGWWILIACVPFGYLLLLLFLCTESYEKDNQWGSAPNHIFKNVEKDND